jgi:hypothetical protein
MSSSAEDGEDAEGVRRTLQIPEVMVCQVRCAFDACLGEIRKRRDRFECDIRELVCFAELNNASVFGESRKTGKNRNLLPLQMQDAP